MDTAMGSGRDIQLKIAVGPKGVSELIAVASGYSRSRCRWDFTIQPKTASTPRP